MFNEETILKHALETTQIGYWDWDVQNNTTYLSPHFRLMLGYNSYKTNVRGIWLEALHPSDVQRVNLAYEHHLASRGAHPFRVEARYYHCSGSVMWLQCQGQVIAWDEAGHPLRMVGSYVDVTARQQAAEELKRYQTALAERNRQLADFAFMNAHKMRGPLARILGLAEVLPLAHSRAEEEKYLRLIVESAQELDGAIKTAASALGTLNRTENSFNLSLPSR
ncbi:MAG: PAS domain-containing protein [Tunicatimonas sp.]